MFSTESIGVSYKEFGLQSIQELYRSRDQDILVEDELELPEYVILKEPGSGWKAVVLSVPGSWIRDLFRKYGESIVSANLRGYLGVRKGSINSGIKETAEREPNNFWVYNNGITCITNSITEKDSKFIIRGISIINGAQTAGALAESEEEDVQNVRVICRIVETTQRALVEKIVRYNNTQNIIKPSDLVSNDRIQKDLARAFGDYDVSYVHRRTTSSLSRLYLWVESLQFDSRISVGELPINALLGFISFHIPRMTLRLKPFNTFNPLVKALSA